MVSSLLMKPAANANSRMARTERWLEKLSNRLVAVITHIYQPMLRFALRHKQSVIISAVVLFTSSAFVFGKMGGEFIPELDEGDIAMQTFFKTRKFSFLKPLKREKEVETLLLKKFSGN